MRGQSSFEAIALFASAALILTVFMLYFGTQIATKAEEREFESLRDLAGTIRQEILLARQAGPGYERTLFLPEHSPSKRIVFTVEYPPGPGATELLVRFEPPLRDTLEASEVLGEGVYGMFSSGTNTVRTYPGGIIVEPDADTVRELIGEGAYSDPFVEFKPEIAFAHIDATSVRLTDTIECGYGVSNLWAKTDGGAADYVDIAWITSADGSPDECETMTVTYGDPAILDLGSGLDLTKGRNLSCAAAYASGSSGGALCDELYSSPRRVARSNNASIVNSPPRIDIVDTGDVRLGVDDTETRRTTWTGLSVGFVIHDIDPSDDTFNASLIKDGTNAVYLECDPCAWNSVNEGANVAANIDVTIPWPAGGSCSDIKRLTFKLRAIEADGSSELYTLKNVDLTDQLRCMHTSEEVGDDN